MTKIIIISSIAKSMNLTTSNVNITQMSSDNSSLSVKCQITIPHTVYPAAVFESKLLDVTASGALTTTIQSVATSYNYTALMTSSCSSIILGSASETMRLQCFSYFL